MGGEFAGVVQGPRILERFGDEFTFHDALFVRVDFPPEADPVLFFEAATVVGSRIERVLVAATLVEASDVRVRLPEDWVSGLDCSEEGLGYLFRWIDSQTGEPMLTARASRLEIDLAD